MADLIEEVKEEESETEIDSVNLEEQASSAKGRKRKDSDQSNGLDSEKIQKIMRKVESTLQQNQNRNKKGKKSTILVFSYHRQNKKDKNQPMADEETAEDSSNISPDNSSYSTSPDNSPSNPLCAPGARL